MKLIRILILTIGLFGTSVALAAPTLKFDITGLKHGPILKNVNAILEAKLKDYEENLTVDDIEQIEDESDKLITNALKPFGYYQPSIKTTLSNSDNNWTLQSYIRPGLPLSITSLIVKIEGPGKNNAAFRSLVKNFPLKVSQILTTKSYDDAKKILFETARQQGFIDAKLSNDDVEIDMNHYRASVTIILQTGRQYFFGKTVFNKTPFSHNFLSRFLNYKTGEPFDSQKLQTLQQRFSQSNYFNGVYIQPKTKSREATQDKKHQVPVNVYLTPKPAQDYSIGVGYGTATGPRATLGANFNHISPHGVYITSYLSVSKVIQSLTAKYVIPGSNPLRNQYSISSSIVRQVPNNNESEYANVAVAYSTNYPSWQRTLQLTLQRERFKVDNNPISNSTMLIPSITFSRLVSDDLINPSKGYRLNVTVKGASSSAFSSTSFIQFLGSLRAIYSFSDHTRILFHGSLGLTKVSDLSKFPLSLRFFAGGPDSVRGFGYQDIGPGLFLKVAGVELQQKIVGKWYGTLFFDAGSASNSFDSAFKKSIGTGVAYYTPIGPVQLSFAHALEKPGKSFSVLLDLGTAL